LSGPPYIIVCGGGGDLYFISPIYYFNGVN
jgi:hypothetical protein